MDDMTDKELLQALEVEPQRKKEKTRSPREARIIAGFEDILKFVEDHGRPPTHGEDKDIFERMYAVRLDALRAQPDCRAVLADLDTHGLLETDASAEVSPADEVDDALLLEQLGVEASPQDDLSELKHVRPRAEIRAAEDIANRTACTDFDAFEPLFAEVRADLDTGIRETRRFEKDASISKGEFFILSGQLVYVADAGDMFTTDYGRKDRRLRVIYDNGMESDLLLRSLQRALYKDPAGRRITEASPGPLFASALAEGDNESGTIYVLKSLSDHPEIAQNRQVIHKIGVTGGDVEARIAGAQNQSTFLYAPVEIAATYKLVGINRSRLEHLLHRFFAAARLELTLSDEQGRPVKPREWFLVPLNVIDEVVARIKDGSITRYKYDPATASLAETVAPEQ